MSAPSVSSEAALPFLSYAGHNRTLVLVLDTPKILYLAKTLTLSPHAPGSSLVPSPFPVTSGLPVSLLLDLNFHHALSPILTVLSTHVFKNAVGL